MADFSAVLKKTIDKLKENTPEAREKVYQKARTTIEAKLAAIAPPPPANVVDRQRKLLEDAIASVEAEYAVPEPEAVAEDIDTVLADLDPAAQEPEQPALEEPEAPEEAPVPEETPEEAEEETDTAPVYWHEGAFEPMPRPGEETSAEASGADADAQAEVPQDADLPQDEPVQEPGIDDGEAGEPVLPGTPPRRRRRGLILTLLALLVLAGAGYAGWHYRDDLTRLANELPELLQTMTGDEASQTAEEEAGEPEPPQEETAADEAEQPPATQPTRKYTQRLMPDGSEVDEGPAGDEPVLGEGTSVAQASAPEEADPQSTAPDAENGEEAAPPAAQDGASDRAATGGQRAFYYEEQTNVSQGSADTGSVVWSLVEESPGNDLPPEPAIRAEATIPRKNLQLKMTIRRNADQSLPASHVVEIIFLTPDNFEGGGIDNVLRVALKRSEQDAGNPLLGIPAKIADGFFLVALSDSAADAQTNTLLLRRQDWIDIPVVYKTGRRALITIEKGAAGERVFNEALTAWQNATDG